MWHKAIWKGHPMRLELTRVSLLAITPPEAPHMINRYGANVSPWSSLCLHLENRLLLWCFYRASLWLRWFLLVGCRRVVFAPSFLCEWSQRPWRSRQIILLPQFFAHTPSRIRRIIKICSVVDLFHWKPFWFILSILSILGSMRLRSRALYILVAMYISVIPQ